MISVPLYEHLNILPLLGSSASHAASTEPAPYVYLNILLLLGSGALCFILGCVPGRRKTYIKNAEQVYELPSVPTIQGIAKPTLPDTLLTLFYIAASTLLFHMGYYTSQFYPEPVEEKHVTQLAVWINALAPVIIYIPLIISYFYSTPAHFRFNKKYLWAALGCVFLVHLINVVLSVSGYYEWLIYTSGTPETQQAVESIQSAPPSFLIPNIVATVIVAPFVEEIFFRGFIFRVLSNKVGVATAAIISGVFFGAVHVSLAQTLLLSIFGIIQCYLYVKSHSIIYPMLMHALFNGLSMAAIFISLSL